MSYLGQVELKSSDIRRIDVTSSTSATHILTWTPPSEQSLIVTINGVKQQNNYTISGTTLTLDTALAASDEMEVVGILDIGTTNIPADDSITTAMVKDDAVTADKLANSINTEISANTAKVTNATHTGDVTGATALTIAVDAVDIPMLSATGTADATTFLRGDNAWASAGGDNTPEWHVYLSADQAVTNAVWTKCAFNTEVIDTDGAYDSSTNYRFTVPADMAGKYFVYSSMDMQNRAVDESGAIDRLKAAIYKNGSAVTGVGYSGDIYLTPGTIRLQRDTSVIVAIMDLSVSDYLEVFGYVSAYGAASDDFVAQSSFGGFKLL